MATINLGKIKPLHKGAYAAGTTYRPLDFTTYTGNLYICKLASTGNLPTNTTYFDLLAAPSAAAVSNMPTGGIAATTVQDAINELDTEKAIAANFTNINNTSDVNKPVSTAQATAIALRYGKNNILGTVSQSAGVPTGAVIERGNNANGYYVRFADGAQICSFRLGGFGSLDGNGTTTVWTFPATFIVKPVVNMGTVDITSPSMSFFLSVEPTTTTATVTRLTAAPFAQTNWAAAMCTATGRWF